MLVWPFLPNGSTETWGFLTEVQDTYTRENRRALRKGAFLKVEYKASLAESQLGFMEGIYRASLGYREDVVIPLWGQAQTASGAVPAGSLTLPVNGQVGDWFHGYAVLWESNEKWEPVEIASADSYLPGETRPGTLSVVSATVLSYTRPLIIPAVRGFFLAGPQITRSGFNNAEVTASFRSNTDLEPPESTWPTLPDGTPIIDEPDIGGGSATILRPETFVDNGTGVIVRVPTKASFLSTIPFGVRANSLSDKLRVRNNLLALQGRKGTLLKLSTHPGEVSIPNVTISGLTIPLTYTGERLALVGRRLYIQTTTSRLLRRILSVTTTTVTLDQALPSITAASRLRVALAALGRLDTDEVQVEDLPGGGGRFSLTMKEQ